MCQAQASDSSAVDVTGIRSLIVTPVCKTLVWLALTIVIGCQGPADSSEPISAADSITFLNVRPGVAFLGDAACFDCHEDQYRGFQTHGMAKSIYPLTSDEVVETFDGTWIRHPNSDFLYRAVEEDGRYWQEEVIRDALGNEIHRLRREMELVVGSGSAARTYLTESDGRLYELPLTWYTQSNHWGFSPGYAEETTRFDRRIPDRCMACHNSYPESVPFVEGKYESVPFGIGCERCHGPGELHVERRLAGQGDSIGVDPTIVNPAHLSLDRRIDVCQQCHLHGTVSLLRDGRHPFDFRPSQSLDEYMSVFSQESDDPSAIRVVSHGDRMMQSPCFLGSAESARPMDCMTCHDPHQGFRDFDHTYFNRTCTGCHAVSELQSSFAGAEQQAVHAAGANCFSCHMPRVETEDVPHASFTDHYIRVVERDADRWSGQGTGDGSLQAYFVRDQGTRVGEYYTGMAYVALARQEGSRELLERGVAILENIVGSVPDSAGEGHFLLGLALTQLDNTGEAIQYLEESVRRGPVPERLNALALAYEAQNKAANRIQGLYERALEIQPAEAEIRVNYGRFLEVSGDLPSALQAYERAAAEEPWLETAHYNLGTAYLRSGDFARAEASLLRAIELEPTHVQARGNLAVLYLQTERVNEARIQFERAAELSPDHPVALANLGSFYMNSGELPRAIPLFEKAVSIQPDYVTALVNLAVAYVNVDRSEEAELLAQRALNLDPGNETAQKVLHATAP